jgi:outer membrane protein assembly factor BamB
MRVESYKFDRYMYPEFFDCYNLSEIADYEASVYENSVNYDDSESEVIKSGYPPQSLDGPLMDSPWPMYCHDVHHTGRSPYSTIDTWDEVWKFATSGWAGNSPAIDNDGVIYIGAYDLYAVYPNGTLKWKFDTKGSFSSSCPVIDENGIIYAGTQGADEKYLYAINPDGTMNWKYPVGGVHASPAIGNAGIIYLADTDNWYIKALYPNGTLKWSYQTNHVIYSSPAIGLDGTIYCGSHDEYVYALYPNNGTLKWKFKTDNWVHGSPTVADDGTIYIGSDDGYLYALYPNNGTMKWKCNIGCIRASPALDEDGTLYVGVWEKKFYAIYPNGTIKWSFNTGNGKVWGSSPALSNDDTIYFGTCDLESSGGIEIIALYTDGTLKWRTDLDTVFSSPAIGENGTVYIGSCGSPGEGFLNAFGWCELEADANGPYYGQINESIQFQGTAKGGYRPYSYHWDFGDGNNSYEEDPTHIYSDLGNFTVVFTVTDNTSNTSCDTTYAWIQIQHINDPPNKPDIDSEKGVVPLVEFDYYFSSIDPEGDDIRFHIDWGDGTSYITDFYKSGETITIGHTYMEKGEIFILAYAEDIHGAVGPEGYYMVEWKSRAVNFNLLELLLERFPMLGRLLNILIK